MIKIYDDRMEISSPGGLGGFMTLDTLTTKRYSRNPQISRVLNELEIVRELNEGISRIYKEMSEFFLKEPIFKEPDRHSFLVILDNNVVMRSKRKTETLKNNGKIKDKWDELSFPEQEILKAISDKGEITSQEVAQIINRGKTTSIKILNNMIEKNLIIWTGTNKKDSYGRYILK